jgi:two-component system, OmpR family, phosphate regulon sensor histidine kinase PhoR
VADPARGKKIFLYLISVIAPGALLIVFTLILIGQDRELALKRAAETRQRLVLEIGGRLGLELEAAKARILANPDLKPAETYVKAVGEIQGKSLIWPWDEASAGAPPAATLRDPRFLDILRGPEREEFAGGDPAKAASAYAALLPALREPRQIAFVRLALARCLSRAGRGNEAVGPYRLLLASPPSLRDEFGLPFGLYAAERLRAFEPESPAVLADLAKYESSLDRLPSAALSLLRAILEKPAAQLPAGTQESAPAILVAVRSAQALRAQAEDVKNELSSAGDYEEPSDPHFAAPSVWKLSGRAPWFLSKGTSAEGRRLLIACDAPISLAAAVAELPKSASPSEGLRVVGAQDPSALPLGAAFPDARLAIPEKSALAAEAAAQPRTALYVMIVLLGLGLAVFGSIFFWRDIRRDLQTAELRSQFVASVSHELKTPLAAIRMFAETLRLDRLRDPEKRGEYLETIVNESQRLDRLLANVLDFSKIEQGQRTYRLEKTSLAAVLESAVRAMDYPLREKGFDLRLNIEKGLPDIPADRDALIQAVLNLLDNAVKYSGESREIELQLAREGAGAAIRVLDRGIGIPEAERKRIFGKFYRVADPRSEGIVGAGLGLALAAHIAEAHGGRIDVESRPGGGTIFAVLLPLEEPHP